MIRKPLIPLLIVAILALGGSAVAHAPDLAKPARMGPIRRNQTTMGQMASGSVLPRSARWFESPVSESSRPAGVVGSWSTPLVDPSAGLPQCSSRSRSFRAASTAR